MEMKILLIFGLTTCLLLSNFIETAQAASKNETLKSIGSSNGRVRRQGGGGGGGGFGGGGGGGGGRVRRHGGGARGGDGGFGVGGRGGDGGNGK